jgi:hypothetical protein
MMYRVYRVYRVYRAYRAYRVVLCVKPEALGLTQVTNSLRERNRTHELWGDACRGPTST